MILIDFVNFVFKFLSVSPKVCCDLWHLDDTWLGWWHLGWWRWRCQEGCRCHQLFEGPSRRPGWPGGADGFRRPLEAALILDSIFVEGHLPWGFMRDPEIGDLKIWSKWPNCGRGCRLVQRGVLCLGQHWRGVGGAESWRNVSDFRHF